jgi:hypothetical protein
VSLPEALEAAAGALPGEADVIRPANGDPTRLLAGLSADARVRVLGWLLAQRPADGDELAEAWSEDAAGQAALLALDEGALPREGRKVLRRLLHRLRSRGVATPAPGPAPTVARLPGLEDALAGAWVTPFDPMGARHVWWLEAHPSGGARLFEAVADDARGLGSFEVYSATRSEVRRFGKQLASTGAVAVEPAAAKALVRRAAACQAERALPKRWIEWRARLEAAPGAKLPGALASEALGPAAGEAPEEREDLERAAQLVAQGALGPWPPSREVMTPIVERLRTALDSPLVVSGATRREQVARLVEEAAAEVFAGAAGEVAAHRFRETAFVRWKSGDEAGARACLAAAAAFASRAPGENPVARAFLERWLAPLIAAATGEKDAPAQPAAEPSLLVRP